MQLKSRFVNPYRVDEKQLGVSDRSKSADAHTTRLVGGRHYDLLQLAPYAVFFT
jgi:hypothetical protein